METNYKTLTSSVQSQTLFLMKKTKVENNILTNCNKEWKVSRVCLFNRYGKDEHQKHVIRAWYPC